jgi:DNA-binding transcriptional LysR family regulator
MDVHLRDLRYFVAVAQHLHFGRAAQELFVSQPALSKQIRALESRLRVRLFDRDQRAVRLTTAGTALLPRALETLDAWSAAERVLGAVAQAAASTLHVGMSTGLGRGLLPAVRSRLADIAPRVTLQIRQVAWHDPTGGLSATMDEGNDAAFVWLPFTEPDRFETLTVAVESRLVMLSSKHPLAGQAAVAFESLLDEPFLALPAAGGAARDFWLASDSRAGRPAVIGAEIASTDETREALVAGLGVCLVAEGNSALFEHDQIAVRPVTGIPPAELVLAWRRDDKRPLLHALVEATQAAIRTEPAP